MKKNILLLLLLTPSLSISINPCSSKKLAEIRDLLAPQQLPLHLAKGAILDRINKKIESAISDPTVHVTLYPGLQETFVDGFCFPPHINNALYEFGATTKTHLYDQEETKKRIYADLSSINRSQLYSRHRDNLSVLLNYNPQALPPALQEKYKNYVAHEQQLQKSERAVVAYWKTEAERLAKEALDKRASKQEALQDNKEYQDLLDHYYEQIQSQSNEYRKYYPPAIQEEAHKAILTREILEALDYSLTQELEQKALELAEEELKLTEDQLRTNVEKIYVEMISNGYTNSVTALVKYLISKAKQKTPLHKIPLEMQWTLNNKQLTKANKKEGRDSSAPFIGLRIAKDISSSTNLIDWVTLEGEVDTKRAGSPLDITKVQASLNAIKAIHTNNPLFSPTIRASIISDRSPQQPQDIRAKLSLTLLKWLGISWLHTSISKGTHSPTTLTLGLVAGDL